MLQAGSSLNSIEILGGYTDFERLGENLLKNDGVRRTEYGVIRRLSTPFPEEEEQDQCFQMGGLS